MAETGLNNRQRLHVVGCYRSGTTLLMELLWHGFHFGGRSAYERSLFEPVPEGDGIYLSKKPPDTVWIESVFAQDPDLFVIAMLRDPRAVVTSVHTSRPGNYFRSYNLWQNYEEVISRLDGHPRFLALRFEDLVSKPAAVQDRVQQQFGFLTRRGAFQDYPEGFEIEARANESLNGARPFDAERIQGWREHLPRIKSQLQQYPDLQKAVVRQGYEHNDDWLKLLDDVEPHVQQYKERPPGLLRRFDTLRRYRRKIRRYRKARGLTTTP